MAAAAARRESICIAFTINEKYADHAAVTMSSIAEHTADKPISFFVLSSDIGAVVKRRLAILEKHYKNVTIIFIDVEKEEFNSLGLTIPYTSIETYYRFLLADLLPSLEKVIYLDVDVLAVGDISSLWEVDIEDGYCAGVEDKNVNAAHKEKIGLPVGRVYLNAGVLLLNLAKMRQDSVTRLLFDFSLNNKKAKYQDQDAINVVLGGGAKALPAGYNYMVWGDKDDIEDPTAILVHLTGAGKPWDKNRKTGFYGENYQDYRYRTYALLNKHADQYEYGLLTCFTDNIGDAIQGIAARRFLPRVDHYINRDAMDHIQLHPGQVVKTIINGWYGYRPENWPPEKSGIYPLPISMFAERRIKDAFSSSTGRAFLSSYGPVGARDLATAQFLDSIGVESYYSGCMTLTLNRDPRVEKKDFILAMDVSDEVVEEIEARTRRQVVRLTVMKPDYTTSTQSIRLAELFLALYQSAHAVVTTRLHVMLPSLALETPVLFLSDITNHEPDRFNGLADLVHRATTQEFIQDAAIYDFDNPPKNKPGYKKIRKRLEEVSAQFTNYDSKKSYLSLAEGEPYNDTEYIVTLGRMANDAHRSHLLERESNWRQETIELRDRELAELRDRLSSVEESLSWRSTRLFRKVSRWVKKVARKGRTPNA